MCEGVEFDAEEEFLISTLDTGNMEINTAGSTRTCISHCTDAVLIFALCVFLIINKQIPALFRWTDRL